MATNGVSYLAGIGMPRVVGSLSIAHSTMSHCETEANVAIKEVDNTINGFQLGDPFEGLTIHVFFQYENTYFGDGLKLRVNNGTAIPIICSMLESGAPYDASDPFNVKYRGASFSYPTQNQYSIVTFVYKSLNCYVSNGTAGVDDHSEGHTPYYVQQAINAIEVPVYKETSIFNGNLNMPGDDLDCFIANGFYNIDDFRTKSHSFASGDVAIPGILEVININGYIVQRANVNQNSYAMVYERICINGTQLDQAILTNALT